MTNKNTTQDMKNELIRDMTKVIPMPKSEARKRLNALMDRVVKEERERIVGILKEINFLEGIEGNKNREIVVTNYIKLINIIKHTNEE